MNNSNLECAICLENILPGKYVILPECLHKYHAKCLRDWEIKQNTQQFLCPECNTEYKFVVKSCFNKNKDNNKNKSLDKQTTSKEKKYICNRQSRIQIESKNDSEDLCYCNIL